MTNQQYASPEFAPVVPISVAARMKVRGCLGGYHLLLAHDVARYPSEYKKVYCAPNQIIIMDNSVIELGHPIDKEIMVQAMNAVYYHGPMNKLVFVLPDHLLDKGKTLIAVDTALREGWAQFIREKCPAAEMMCVPQGKDIGEWVDCIEQLATINEIKWVGIPRNFREKLGGSRLQAIQMASILRPDWNIHMLGFSDDLHDDVISCHFAHRLGYKVAGIDSAVPIRMAMREGVTLRFSNQVHSPRSDWWDKPGDWEETGGLVEQNLRNIRQWIA